MPSSVLKPMTEATEESQEARWPGRLAVGVVRGDPSEVFLASSVAVLGRLFALRIVASADPEEFLRAGTLTDVRRALLEERWADALLLWMEATGSAVDGYPDELVWTDAARCRTRCVRVAAHESLH